MQIYVPECYTDLFDPKCEAKRFVGLTGRSSGKTEAFARKVYQMCDTYKESFIIVRDKTTYLKSTIWRTMKRVAKEIGVADEYKFPESQPLRIVHKSGKFTIDLYGIEDDSQKLKGYEGEGKQLCGCWFEEFGNISDPDKIAEVEETIARSMSDHAVWLYSGNPPKEANAWSRAWVSKIRNLKEFKVFDTTFADIWHLLSNQNKDKIRLAYLMDRDKWEFVYLGKPSSNDGIVYNNFNVDKYCISVNDKLDGMVIAWSIGVDVAVDRDKTVGVLSLKLDNGRIITRAIVEHDPRDKGNTKLTIHEQADLIEKWYREILGGINIGGEKTNISSLPHAIVVDTQDFGMTQELLMRGLPAIKVSHKDVVRDIERGKTLINCNRLYVVYEKCKPLIAELESILWRSSVKIMNLRVENYGAVTKQQWVIGEDDVENAWRYGHSWLLAGDYQTFVLPPLKEYDEIKEINIMKLSDAYTSKGVVRNV